MAVGVSGGTESQAVAAPRRLYCRITIDASHPLYGSLAAVAPHRRAAALLAMAERAAMRAGAETEVGREAGAVPASPSSPSSGTPSSGPPLPPSSSLMAAASEVATLAAAVLRLTAAVERLVARPNAGEEGQGSSNMAEAGADRAASLDAAWS